MFVKLTWSCFAL